MNLKKCSKCKTVKPIDNFWKDKNTKDGLMCWCTKCSKEVNAKWSKSPAGKAFRKKLYRSAPHKKSNLTNFKHYAKMLVFYGVRLGYIEKNFVCSICNIDTIKEKKIIHGHHDDYLKPLEVRWICQLCHLRLHKKEKE